VLDVAQNAGSMQKKNNLGPQIDPSSFTLLPPKRHGKADAQGAHVVPPALGDEEHLARLEQAVNIGHLPKEGKALVVDCIQVHLKHTSKCIKQ